jgi:hypothetical protein
MGRGKTNKKAPPKIPYVGALKRYFNPILDANFPIRATNLAGSRRKYKIKNGNATRQWSLQVLKARATLSIVPVVDAGYT